MELHPDLRRRLCEAIMAEVDRRKPQLEARVETLQRELAELDAKANELQEARASVRHPSLIEAVLVQAAPSGETIPA